MPQDNTPILIGAALTVQKEKDLEKVKSPLALLSEAAEKALADAGADKHSIDTMAGIRFVTDSPEGRMLPYGKYKNI
ncbi:MAG: acetyl-CoA acetyltransferase, partial [Parvibaculales bacterium]